MMYHAILLILLLHSVLAYQEARPNEAQMQGRHATGGWQRAQRR